MTFDGHVQVYRNTYVCAKYIFIHVAFFSINRFEFLVKNTACKTVKLVAIYYTLFYLSK